MVGLTTTYGQPWHSLGRSPATCAVGLYSLPLTRSGPILAFFIILCALIASWAHAAEIPVTSPNPTGPGSLDEAIYRANRDSDPPHTIVFDITGVVITLTGPLEPLSVDGTQIRGERDSGGEACGTCEPRITIDGGPAAVPVGINIAANDCIVTGLLIAGCTDAGIRIAPGYQRNHIGQPGPECCERVWLGLNNVGIKMTDSNTNHNVVRNSRIFGNITNGIEVHAGPYHNRIGADANGERNYIYSNGQNGIYFDTLEFAKVEYDTIAGNVIYSNGYNGIEFYGAGNGFEVQYCLVEYNRIGIDENGTAAGNALDGIYLHGASPYNVIAHNTVVSNGNHGISLFDYSDEDSVSHNHVGVLADGTPMGNTADGIYVETDANRVGPNNVVMYNGTVGAGHAGIALRVGTWVAPRVNIVGHNIVAGNTGSGITLSGTGATENDIAANTVGADESGMGYGNTEFGILCENNATVNTIRDNVIGFNLNYGVRLDHTSHSNIVYRNHIGTDETDQDIMPNLGGILIGSSMNTIGGTDDNDGNVIGHNDLWGIRARSPSIQIGNYIAGNLIGTNADDHYKPNGSGGIWLGDGLINNDIGDLPTVPGAKNIIKHNYGPGVKVGEVGAANVPVQNRIQTNMICDNFEVPIFLTNGGNDMLPPPTVFTATNAFNLGTGELTSQVSGEIGYTHPPNVTTRIQVFYDTRDTCGVFLGQTLVSGTEVAWAIESDPLPTSAGVYATETTKGPNPPGGQPEMQTSGISTEERLTWWWDMRDGCDARYPCPWLGTDSDGRSASWIDYNNDGLVDLFMANAGGDNFLLEYQGDGVFVPVDIGDMAAPAANTACGVWGDADGDGDLDAYIVNGDGPNMLFTYDDGVGFTDVTPPLLADSGPGRTAAWIDADVDGDLDLYLCNMGAENRLFRNEGGLLFSDATTSVVGNLVMTVSAVWGDYNEDGFFDVYIVNNGGPNRLCRNDGGMMFTDVTTGPLADLGMGIAASWGEFFILEDTGPDLYVVNDGGANVMLQNMGGGVFANVTSGPEGDTGPGRAVSAEDLDLDGHLDLVLANEGVVNFWLNDGMGSFTHGGVLVAERFRACPMADFDLDGDLDGFLTSGGCGLDNILAMNLQADGHHWLHIGLSGEEGNDFGVGARIEVEVEGRSAVQKRYVTAGTGSGGQSSILAEFGVGHATEVQTVRVIWPSGHISEIYGVPTDTMIVVEETDTDGVEPQVGVTPTALLTSTPNPFFGSTCVAFQLERPGAVRLRVYDSSGRLVRSLANRYFSAGGHELVWNGRNQRDESVGNGIYFLRLETARERYQQKLTRIE